ncbi:MAG: hypothetical protein AABX70_02780 [Nanoarchaeota archaeon]
MSFGLERQPLNTALTSYSLICSGSDGDATECPLKIHTTGGYSECATKTKTVFGPQKCETFLMDQELLRYLKLAVLDTRSPL